MRAIRVLASLGGLLAALAIGPSALARGAPPDSATPEQQATATEHYQRGVDHFKAGRFKEAAAAFELAYEAVASPNAHMMMARAYRDAGELTRALEEFAATQREAAQLAASLPKYAAAAESAEKELLELLPRVAALAIEVAGGGAGVVVTVGTREVPADVLPTVGVAPGPHLVIARAADGREVRQDVMVRKGERLKVRLDFDAPAKPPGTGAAPEEPAQSEPGDAPPSTDEPPRDPGAKGDRPSLRPYAYVAGGVGVLGLVGFAVFGSMANSTYAELEADCPGGVCPADRQSDIDSGASQQLLANLSLGVGVVGLGAGVALWLLDQPGRESGAAARPREGVRVYATPRSVGVLGRF
ncbi:MAG: hypothetical protein IT376_06440 [Polyangiaceae bacterium]|nr:hypothetical protein [Polyangiaceae bacterium]